VRGTVGMHWLHIWCDPNRFKILDKSLVAVSSWLVGVAARGAVWRRQPVAFFWAHFWTFRHAIDCETIYAVMVGEILLK